jgi:hypothetical protein
MTRHLCLVPRILDRWIRQTDSKKFGPERAPQLQTK